MISQAGLISIDEKYGVHDKFWNRVMFPIMDVNSRVIGFGGRVMGDAKPKYLNSPETIIFDKSRNLYGLNRARKSRKPYFLLCEGYMDVISLHQAGFTNAVASLGTAWSDSQFEQLKKHVSSLCFIPDSDIAEGKPYGPGFEAVMTNGAAAIRKGFHVTVRELPFAEIPSETEGEIQYAKNDADSYILPVAQGGLYFTSGKAFHYLVGTETFSGSRFHGRGKKVCCGNR